MTSDAGTGAAPYRTRRCVGIMLQGSLSREGTASAWILLHDVRELMRQQRLPRRCGRRVLLSSEHNMRPDGIRIRAEA